MGGRSLWLAWPVGLICAGIIGALVWIAAPGVPGAIDFAGQTLRGSTSTPLAEAKGGTATPPAQLRDCRDLYPDSLWAELVWTPKVLLSQNTSAAATSATPLVDALHPKVILTCAWRLKAATTISTTLATVDAAAAAPLAQPALVGQGFTCSASGDGVRCTKADGETIEEDVIRSGFWLSSQFRSWHPDGFTDRLVERIW
ncbi:MAG: hypothetical protein KKH75_04155 [Actinobacteria bacterium]|nr:hypothetical protein [Actinomycetota bacterium]